MKEKEYDDLIAKEIIALVKIGILPPISPTKEEVASLRELVKKLSCEAYTPATDVETAHAPVIQRERHTYCIKGAAVDIHGEPYLKKAPYTYIQEICPLCGATLTGEWNNYCDKCGAKMEREE